MHLLQKNDEDWWAYVAPKHKIFKCLLTYTTTKVFYTYVVYKKNGINKDY